jgi:hypothetical protein
MMVKSKCGKQRVMGLEFGLLQNTSRVTKCFILTFLCKQYDHAPTKIVITVLNHAIMLQYLFRPQFRDYIL